MFYRELAEEAERYLEVVQGIRRDLSASWLRFTASVTFT
ncbi:MAG: hypothetical protein RI919_389 [Actinomycetota bacterium]